MRSGFIYRISAPGSNSVYVGQSQNPDVRWKQHRRDKHANPGLRSFLAEHRDAVIISWPVDDMSPAEIEYERAQRAEGFDLLNMTPCGNVPPNHTGKKRSAATNALRSAILKGKKRPDNVGGWKHTAETRAKMSAQRIGRTAWNKGKVLPSHPGYMKGKTHSTEAKAKISASSQRLWDTLWAGRRAS